MKLHEGVYLPDHEKHLLGMISPKCKRFARLQDGRGTYQRHKYLAVLPFVPEKKVFVDIGGHVGLWSMQAEEDFEEILAFEPHPDHAEIFPHNMRTDKWTLRECALGDEPGSVSLTGMNGSSGDTHIDGDGTIPLLTLDSFNLERVDLIKIDTEGYELPILLGATATIKRTRPVIVVEQKGRDAMYFRKQKNGAIEYLRGLGMRELRKSISGDFFMGW